MDFLNVSVKNTNWNITERYSLTGLKEYSVILTTSFYDMNQKIQTKKLTSKISVDSNFIFTSYA